MKVKKGDNVEILTGKDKGKSGKVLKSFPKLGKVIIEGLNLVNKHQKSRKGAGKGQMVQIAMPIDASNVRVKGEVKSKAKSKK
jgi:large subunit ribosomal protein L24